jgi:hypothetical protein
MVAVGVGIGVWANVCSESIIVKIDAAKTRTTAKTTSTLHSILTIKYDGDKKGVCKSSLTQNKLPYKRSSPIFILRHIATCTTKTATAEKPKAKSSLQHKALVVLLIATSLQQLTRRKRKIKAE